MYINLIIYYLFYNISFDLKMLRGREYDKLSQDFEWNFVIPIEKKELIYNFCEKKNWRNNPFKITFDKFTRVKNKIK